MIGGVTSKRIEEFQHYDQETNSYITIPGGLKHILVFGQSRQGKSSIINMMTGKNKSNGAQVSPDIIGCTFSTRPWFNETYCFWDTAGLNEQDQGLVNNQTSTKNLINFVRQSKGFHGAMMAVNWSNFNSSATKQNWDLFYDCFLDQRVPIIVCITGRGIESADDDQQWIQDQKDIFDKMGYDSKTGNGFKAVVYSKDLSEINKNLKSVYTELRDRSIRYINTLLERNVTNEFYNPLDEMTFFDTFKKMWNTLMKIVKLDQFMVTVREAFKELLVKLGYSNSDAEVISRESYLD